MTVKGLILQIFLRSFSRVFQWLIYMLDASPDACPPAKEKWKTLFFNYVLVAMKNTYLPLPPAV